MDIMDIAIASKLAESGGGGGGSIIFAVTADGGITCDKTWKEIKDAYDDGKIPILYFDASSADGVDKFVYPIGEIYSITEESEFGICTVVGTEYKTNDENGYPTTT